MIVRKIAPKGLFLVCLFISLEATAQKQVDLNALEQENPGLFSGRYFRGGVGIARASQNYGSTFTGIAVNPLSLNFEFGSRINRKYGVYFGLCFNVMLAETHTGGLDLLLWSQNSINLGGLYYLKGGNSYISPEIGLGYGFIEDYYGSAGHMGVHTALKYGYDWHILEKIYLGAQAFVSYDHCKDQDDLIDISTGEVLVASTLIFGINLTLKFGK